ncbi:hypothetical protein AVEN_48023-1, partial [Araneus ventricosus]
GYRKHLKYGETVSKKTATECLRFRAIETTEVRRDRLEEDRHRRAASRAIETPEVRRDRLEEDRHRRGRSTAMKHLSTRRGKSQKKKITCNGACPNLRL